MIVYNRVHYYLVGVKMKGVLECCKDREIVSMLGDESARVCRGVLRVWGMRIQDSRTDFGGFWGFFIDSATMRGWCKI
jgi:hypothetical protein